MTFKKKTLNDLDLDAMNVLVRADLNVPMDGEQRITSDLRIRKSVPTVRRCLENGARRVTVMSHLGRPKGKVIESLRLAPVAARLSEILGEDVLMASDCAGESVERELDSWAGRVALLENLRFHPGEKAGDEDFARRLARLGEALVCDAFGAVHRAHASVAVLPRLLPSAAGPLLERELNAFDRVLTTPDAPFVALLGGAKVTDKLPVVEHLLDRVDTLLIGGGMCFTFLVARGVAVGNSLVDREHVDSVRAMLNRAESGKTRGRIVLPDDFVVAKKIAEGAETGIAPDSVPEDMIGVDIGPRSAKRFAEIIAAARTVVWNGPMGVFEISTFAAGTARVARAIADNRNAVTVAGGGDSVAALDSLGLTDRLTHVSTGGGASLELLEGRTLPGIAVLPDRES